MGRGVPLPMKTAPTSKALTSFLAEDEAVVERLSDVIADAMNVNRAGRLEHEAALAVLRTLAGKE